MRKLQSILCVLIGLALVSFAWYESGGRDGEFEIAYLLRDSDHLLYAVGGLVFLGTGIFDRLISRKRSVEAPTAGA